MPSVFRYFISKIIFLLEDTVDIKYKRRYKRHSNLNIQRITKLESHLF